MKNFRIIPRLEIKTDKVIKGIRMEGLRKVGDPTELAVEYFKDGADEIFYDDIVASLYDRKYNLNLIKKISSNIQIPLLVSGGIKSLRNMHEIFNAGADKIALNTNAYLNPNIIYEAAKVFGSQSICVQIQFKQYYENYWEILTESGRERTGKNIFDWINEVQLMGAGEIILISVDHDGIGNFISSDTLKEFRSKCKLPLIYGGGINSNENILDLIDLKYDGASISNALHFNKMQISNIKKHVSKIKNNIINL
tara:strand:+ start:8471 stop:9229 length:759 start_codon:yes stop_codon:yes gene_type:complete